MRFRLTILIAVSFFAVLSFPARALDLESEGRERGRVIPQILSGDEARQAADQLTGEHPEQTTPEEVAAPGEGRVKSDEPVDEPAPEKIHELQERPNEPERKAASEFTDAELGPPLSEGMMKEMIEGLRGKDTLFDPGKVEQLRRKVDDAMQNTSPEQREKLLSLQRQINETVQRVMRAQQERASKDQK